MIDRFEALKSLRPNAEFIVIDNNYESIECLTDGVIVPTLDEIDAEVERLLAIQAEKPLRKAALLDRLGITEDDAKLLLS
jgi:hypothetical protein